VEKIKIDIISGFLGAGKTTLIKKLVKEAYKGQKVVLIENEFGEIGVDGGFLKDSGINITEMSQGCICCSLVCDFKKALGDVVEKLDPSRIVIEPSGVGKLSDIIVAVEKMDNPRVELNSFAVVVDAKKCKMYMKNFGEFFNNQVESANCIILSHNGDMDEKAIESVVALLRQHNPTAEIITTPWDRLDGAKILDAMEQRSSLDAVLEQLKSSLTAEDYEEDDDDDDDEDHDHEEEGEHHHHHHHHHHGGDDDHDADEVFESFGTETLKSYSKSGLEEALAKLGDEKRFGQILRAKGMVPETGSDKWIDFDYVPGEVDVRYGPADVTGRICVIGSGINRKEISGLFGLEG
jgi:G3E family GTPase